MLDFLASMSIEKLVLDAEAIGYAQRLSRGIEARGETLAIGMFAQLGLSGDFLKLKETRQLFRSEQYLPSTVIDRGSLRAWQEAGAQDAFSRAGERVDALVAEYERRPLRPEIERELERMGEAEGQRTGLAGLPGIGAAAARGA